MIIVIIHRLLSLNHAFLLVFAISIYATHSIPSPPCTLVYYATCTTIPTLVLRVADVLIHYRLAPFLVQYLVERLGLVVTGLVVIAYALV